VMRGRFPNRSPTLGPRPVQPGVCVDLETVATDDSIVSPISSPGSKTPPAKSGYVQALYRDRERATTMDLQNKNPLASSPIESPKTFHQAFERHL